MPLPETVGPRAARAQAGFTLIELMIVVAVVALLATIAMPAYQDYVRRGKIADALGELSTQRVRLEQYYQDNRNYGSTASACGVAMPTANHFSYSCNWGAGGTSQSFLITATGVASAGMDGYTYTIDDANAQRTTRFAGATVTANCWMLKRGETC
jgi:type IV pilus assembly protein PilE